jgi:hypothetical protein
MAKAKFGQNREGQIALAWIIWKYSTRGVDCNPKKIPKWLERRSRQTNLSEVSLYIFLQKVIVPSIFHQKMVWQNDPTIVREFQDLALALASYELYRDEHELEDQAMSFQKHGLSPFSEFEVRRFMDAHIIAPARVRKDEAEAAKQASLNPKINRN